VHLLANVHTCPTINNSRPLVIAWESTSGGISVVAVRVGIYCELAAHSTSNEVGDLQNRYWKALAWPLAKTAVMMARKQNLAIVTSR